MSKSLPRTNASIILPFPRQPTMPSPSKRGGRREPLASFDIFIPTWTKYQKGDAERYIRMERGTRHNRQLASLQPQQRWVWLALVLSADREGWLKDVTVKDLAFESECGDLKMIRRSLEAMIRVGLIAVDGDFQSQSKEIADDLSLKSKAIPKPSQSQSKEKIFGMASNQSQSKEITDDLSRNGAGYSDTEQSRTEQIRTESVPAPPGPAPATASAPSMDEQKNLMADLLPEIAVDLWGYLWQHATETKSIKDREAYMAKSVASLRDRVSRSNSAIVTSAWRQTIAKGAMWSYCDAIIDSAVKKAVTAAPASTAKTLEAKPARQVGGIYDVNLRGM